MKCVIGGAHIKVFGRAIHAIARISDGFWFDPIEKGSVLPLFRCLNTLERNVEKCTIYTDFKHGNIVFQLFCRHGVVKTHNLAFQECEPLQAVFAKHLCPNVLKAWSRQLADILIHFPNYQDEVTLAVTPVKVCFKTYTEDEMDFAFAMHTEIHLNPEEFEYFQVGVDSEVTFCLKELRGLLAFAEAISAPVAVHFDMPGRPIVFSLEDTVVEASFVLATLADTENRLSCESLHPSQDQRRSPAVVSSNEGTVSNRNLQDPETAKNPADNFTIMAEAQPSNPGYSKFHSLFFGAISSSEEDVTSALATASDTEDFGN